MSDDVRQRIGSPSAFFEANRERLRASLAVGPALDLACGRGRHSLAAAELGLEVLALDRNEESLAELASVAPVTSVTSEAGRIETRVVDLEAAVPPALDPGSFGAVLVFRYLHRPLTSWIEGLLAPGGVLLYETFTLRQRQLGWGPKSDAFLLAEGELPTLFPGLTIERYEEGPSRDARPAETARLLASRPR